MRRRTNATLHGLRQEMLAERSDREESIIALDDDQRSVEHWQSVPNIVYRTRSASNWSQLSMSDVGQPERATQNRVIALFRDELGYRYLGDWTDRDGNSNIEEGLLTDYLTKRGYTPAQISARHLQAAHRGGQPQPQPLRQQPGGLQPAALRRAGEDRGGQGHRDRPPDRLGGAGEERLRHRRGSDAAAATTSGGPTSCSTSTASPSACWS